MDILIFFRILKSIFIEYTLNKKKRKKKTDAKDQYEKIFHSFLSLFFKIIIFQAATDQSHLHSSVAAAVKYITFTPYLNIKC